MTPRFSRTQAALRGQTVCARVLLAIPTVPTQGCVSYFFARKTGLPSGFLARTYRPAPPLSVVQLRIHFAIFRANCAVHTRLLLNLFEGAACRFILFCKSLICAIMSRILPLLCYCFLPFCVSPCRSAVRRFVAQVFWLQFQVRPASFQMFIACRLSCPICSNRAR